VAGVRVNYWSSLNVKHDRCLNQYNNEPLFLRLFRRKAGMTFQFIIHYFLHLVFPAFVAFGLFPRQWVKVYGVLLLTMLIDLDHLFASPIYDESRCSIGFHPLHSTLAIIIYIVLLLFSRSRVPAIGLILHILTDWLDCFLHQQLGR
jgi:hypothetical protein